MEAINTTPTAAVAENTTVETVATQGTISTDSGGLLNPSANPLEYNSQQAVQEQKWFERLPEELRGTASKFKDETAAIQAYHNLQSLMGKKISDLPKDEIVKHFSPEQLADFYKAQGVPEAPEAYQIEGLPDYLTKNPNVSKGLEEAKAIAHKHGVSGELFKEFVKLEYDLHQKAVQERQAANFAELSNTYGANIEKANNVATEAARALGGDQAVEALVQSGLASHPMIFKMLYKAGQMMQQDRIPVQGTSTPGNSDSVAQIRQQIKELYNDQKFYTRLKEQSPNEVNHLHGLYERLAQLESRG